MKERQWGARIFMASTEWDAMGSGAIERLSNGQWDGTMDKGMSKFTSEIGYVIATNMG
jgi:hypothetical protein